MKRAAHGPAHAVARPCFGDNPKLLSSTATPRAPVAHRTPLSDAHVMSTAKGAPQAPPAPGHAPGSVLTSGSWTRRLSNAL